MCSSTSEQITRSKVASGNGQVQGVALDRGGVQRCGVELAGLDHRGERVAATPSTSSRPASRATTSAPRRAASKAWRPKPHPRSRILSPRCRPSWS